MKRSGPCVSLALAWLLKWSLTCQLHASAHYPGPPCLPPLLQVPIPFPAAVLIRPKALVVNLETVRMIICANQCYVLSGGCGGCRGACQVPC